MARREPEAEARTVAQDGRVAHNLGNIAFEIGDQTLVGAGVVVGAASERAVSSHGIHLAPVIARRKFNANH